MFQPKSVERHHSSFRARKKSRETKQNKDANNKHPNRKFVQISVKKFKKINIVSQLYDVLLEYQMNLLRIAILKIKIINYGNN